MREILAALLRVLFIGRQRRLHIADHFFVEHFHPGGGLFPFAFLEMFRHSQVGVPVAGIIENMAWFTPAELPENRYYLFGKGGARALAERCGVDFLGEIPIVQSIMEGGDAGTPGSTIDARVEETYRTIARKIVENVMKTCS